MLTEHRTANLIAKVRSVKCKRQTVKNTSLNFTNIIWHTANHLMREIFLTSGPSPYKSPGGRWRDGNVQVISDDETNVPQRLLVINPTDARHRRTQFLQVEVAIVHPVKDKNSP